jgi:hypothetical protein
VRAKLAKLFILLALAGATALPGSAQSGYSASDLDTLVGPVALYPDPLLTNVIKASTFPDQIVAASQGNTEDSSWDDSVKAVDSYPEVITMMATNLDWTKSLGWAATNQLADTMDAVQRYRYRAQQAGNLSNDGKVQVIQEGTTIRIEPANPQVIYVPSYPPEDVDDDDFAGAFVYGAAVATSAYLWSNVYHWNDNCFYNHPYGYRPPAAYYRPYGWQNAGVYTGNAVRVNGGNNVVRGPVTVNNVNVNANRAYVNNSSRTNVNRSNTSYNRSNVNNTYNRSDVNNRVQAQSRTTVRPNIPSQMPANAGNWSNPGLGSYSSAGSSMRESNRGAYSRGSTSMGSGARMGGGGFRGGRR